MGIYSTKTPEQRLPEIEKALEAAQDKLFKIALAVWMPGPTREKVREVRGLTYEIYKDQIKKGNSNGRDSKKS